MSRYYSNTTYFLVIDDNEIDADEYDTKEDVFDGGYTTETNVFSTMEKAKKYFDLITERELTQSWVRDLVDAKESGNDCLDDTLEIEETSLHAYDSRNFDSTDIYIVERIVDEVALNR